MFFSDEENESVEPSTPLLKDVFSSTKFKPGFNNYFKTYQFKNKIRDATLHNTKFFMAGLGEGKVTFLLVELLLWHESN